MLNRELLDEINALKKENQVLRSHLEEAEELKRAISEGDLDALVIPRPEGELVFTLDSADHTYRVLVETMNEGTATLAFDGTILYCNRRFSELLRMHPQDIVGKSIYRFIAPESEIDFTALLKLKKNSGEINLKAKDGIPLPVYLSISLLQAEGSQNAWCLVITDLTEITEYMKNEEALKKAYEEIQAQSEEIQVQNRELQAQSEELKIANDTLAESEERFHTMANALPQLAWIAEPDGYIYWYNDRWYEYTGTTPEQMEGWGWQSVHDPAVLPTVLKQWRASIATGKPFDMEFPLRGADGIFRPFLTRVMPYKDTKGQVLQWFGTNTDISERKQTEETLRESEEKFRQMADNIGEVFFIFTSDWKQTIFVSPAYERVWGRPLKDVYDNSIDWLEGVHPDDRWIPLAVMNKHICGNIKDTDTAEFRVLRPDGTLRWIFARTYPILDEQKGVYRITGIAEDITERKMAEEALRESEERYRTLFNNVNDAIFIVDLDGRLIDVNQVAVERLGYSREELLSMKVYDIDYLEYTTRNPERINEILKNGHAVFESAYVHRDRTIIPVEISCRLIEYKGQTLIFSIIRDITERKRAEEEIQSTSNMLQLVMNNVPHGIFWKDRNSRFMGCNNVFAKATGIGSLENIVGKTDYDLPWSPEQTKWFLEYDRKVMERDTPEYHIVEQIWQADGKLAWVETNKIPLHDAKGNVVGILGTYEDITERKRAEEELRKSEERFRTLAENSPDIIARFDRQNRHTYVNPAAAKPYCHSQEEIIGKTNTELGMNHELVNFWESHYNEVFNTGKSKEMEFHYTSSQGKEYYFNTQIVPEFVDGKVTSVLAISRDITELKEVEAKLKDTLDNLDKLVKERTAELEEAYKSLKESEERLAEAQKIAHIGNWDWNIVTGELYWSDEMYRIFGLKPLEFEMTYAFLISHYVHPDDRDYLDNAVKGALNGNPDSIDYRIILDNGEERIVHAKGEVVFDNQNNPIRIRGITQDITERKQAVEALRESEERFNLAVKAAQEGVWDWNMETDEVWYSPRYKEMLGYSEAEIEHHVSAWLRLLHPDDKEKSLQLVDAVMRGERDYEIEFRLRHKDGHYLNILSRGYPVRRESDGKIVRIVGIHLDITERKQSEEAMAKIEVARKQEIHHRIKNNLQVISSLLDLQADKFRNKECIKDSEVLEAFKVSQDRVISMSLIHEELYKGGGFETLDFSQYIKKLVENLLYTYSVGNKVSLKLDLAENAFFDMDIAVPLGMIINELVTNSFKHAFTDIKEGEIYIEFHSEENDDCIKCIHEDCASDYVLTVTDNGIGVPKDLDIEDLDSLGMQLVTSLVDQLDGGLKLNRDNGTEFTIRFSVAEKENHASSIAHN